MESSSTPGLCPPCGYWLLLLDLDGTLWDHMDISALEPPFEKTGADTITSRDGVVVRLHRDMVELVKWARRSGAVVASLSWNNPGHALGALEAFGLLELFDYHAIEPHPDKGAYAARLLERLSREKGCLPPPCCIVYIDDRDIHVEGVRQRLGDIVFLQAWRSFNNYHEAVEAINRALGDCSKRAASSGQHGHATRGSREASPSYTYR